MGASADDLRTFALEVLEDVHDWIRAADTKAGLIIAAAGVFFAEVVQALSLDPSAPECMPWGDCAVLTVGVIAAVLSASAAVAAFTVLLPRVTSQHPPPGTSLMFFAHIADMDDYAARLGALASDAGTNSELQAPEHDLILDQVAQQIAANSDVAQRKYKCVSRAVWLLLLAAGVSALFLILHAL